MKFIRALINWPKRIKALLDDGSLEKCPSCYGLSAYAYQDVNALHGIAKIGATSSFEWQCGHCRTYWMDANSPLNCEAYTHNPPDEKEEHTNDKN